MMKFKYLIVLILTPLIFILDQISKWLIVSNVELGTKIAVIPGYFDIVHTRNIGAAFGMMSHLPDSFRIPFFYVIAFVAAAAIVIMLWKLSETERLIPLAFALVLAGIAGNIFDRIKYGSVVDFLSVHIRDAVFSRNVLGWKIEFPLDWPAFNVADSAITAAMFLLIISAFRKESGFKS